MRNALLVLSACLVTLAASFSRAQESSGFTADERARLLGGELVRRDLSRQEGDHYLYGDASWQRIEAPVDVVWAAVVEPDSLTRLVPSLDEARVVEEAGDERVVYVHHSYGIAETSYHVTMHLDHEAHALSFALDPSRPHDVSSGRGHLALTPFRGGTIVEWGMLVDPGTGIVIDLFGPMLSEWLLQPPRCLSDELAGRPSC
jgi:hypothetical protein